MENNQVETICPYTRKGAVRCFEPNCEKCGWNPKVEAFRKQNLNGIGNKVRNNEIEQQNQDILSIEQQNNKEHYGQWISFAERKPKDDELVLIYTDRGTLLLVRYCKNDNCFKHVNKSGEIRKVLYWMETPSLPSEA